MGAAIRNADLRLQETPFIRVVKYGGLTLLTAMLAGMLWAYLADGTWVAPAWAFATWVLLTPVLISLDVARISRKRRQLAIQVSRTLLAEVDRLVEVAKNQEGEAVRVPFDVSDPPCRDVKEACLFDGYAIVTGFRGYDAFFLPRGDFELEPTEDEPGQFSLRLPSGFHVCVARPEGVAHLRSWLEPSRRP